MGTVISNLKARFGVDTTDFKNGLKDGQKATEDFKGAAGGILDEFASMFGVNMSAVTDAIGTANKSLNFLGQGFTAAKKGGEAFAVGMKIVKFALTATGIGALIVLLGSVIAYFQKSGEGSDKFAKILSQLKSVLNNVVERLAAFGKGIVDFISGRFKQGVQEMGEAFKGMGKEITEDWKAAGKLADAEDALEDREIALIDSLSARKAKAAELRQQAKEEIEDQKKKLSLLNQAESIIKGVYSDEISLQKEGLRIMKEKLAIQTSDPTDEQRRAVAEQEAKINDLYRSQADELKGLAREKQKVIGIVTQELELEKAKASQIAIAQAAITNIKIPDLSIDISKALAPLAKLQETVKTVSIDISKALNEAFADVAFGIGEFLGNLMIGDAGMKDFGRTMAAAFADLAITIGKIAITSAITVGALANILSNPVLWPVALAAGIALVAVGTAIKGSLKSAASGGGSGSSMGKSIGSSGSSSLVYDTTKLKQTTLTINGTLRAEGKDLVYVFNQENTRKNAVT